MSTKKKKKYGVEYNFRKTAHKPLKDNFSKIMFNLEIAQLYSEVTIFSLHHQNATLILTAHLLQRLLKYLLVLLLSNPSLITIPLIVYP